MNTYTYMLPESWDVFKPGDRVVTTASVLDYPLRPLPPGQTGTVIYSSDDVGISVRMDAHHPDLDEWDNQAQISFDVSALSEGELAPMVPLRKLTAEDKITWTNPFVRGHEVDIQEVSARVHRAMLSVAAEAGKAQTMASHFKALSLTGPYNQLYVISANLEDVTDSLNTTLLGYLGVQDDDTGEDE